MIKYIFATLLLVFVSTFSFAEGGKNQKQNPIFEEGCVTAIPAGMEDCTQVELKPPQSGIAAFNCPTVVTCPDDIEED